MSLHSVLENVYWVDRSLLHFCGEGGKSKYHKKKRASDRKTAVLKTRLTPVQRFYRRKPMLTNNEETQKQIWPLLFDWNWPNRSTQFLSHVTITQSCRDFWTSLKKKKDSITEKISTQKVSIETVKQNENLWCVHKSLMEIYGVEVANWQKNGALLIENWCFEDWDLTSPLTIKDAKQGSKATGNFRVKKIVAPLWVEVTQRGAPSFHQKLHLKETFKKFARLWRRKWQYHQTLLKKK